MILLLYTAAAGAQSLVIPQIADGNGWQTTLVLTNSTAGTLSGSINFFQETGGGATQSWNPGLAEGSAAQNFSLAGGGTLFLHTTGAGSTTSVGWAQVQAPAGVVAYAIFTQHTAGRPDAEGTAPAAGGTSRVLVPFDNASGFVTSAAIVNPSGANESISVNIETDTGAVSQASLPALPAQGHTAFSLAQQFPATAGHRGLAEFYTDSGSLAMLALRFNPTGAFTAAPVYAASGAPVIGGGTPPPGLPQFTSITVTATFSPDNAARYQVGIQVLNPVSGGYTFDSMTGAPATIFPTPPVIGLSAAWNSVTVSGQTLTFNDLKIGPTSIMVDATGSPHGVTAASLTLTLSPDTSSQATGSVSGSLSITSNLGTLSGPVSGGYTARQ